MGFLRSVTLVCDGPCGQQSGGEKAPDGWHSVTVHERVSLKPGEMGPPPLKGWFCPECTKELLDLLHLKGFRIYKPRT